MRLRLQDKEDEAHGEESIAFTNEAIMDANRAFLRGLPRRLRLEFQAPRMPEAEPLTVRLVHGSPRRINEYLSSRTVLIGASCA